MYNTFSPIALIQDYAKIGNICRDSHRRIHNVYN